MSRIEKLFPPEYQHHISAVTSIIDELSKNAIKANHKFLILRKRIIQFLVKQGLNTEAATEQSKEITSDALKYNEYLGKNPEILENMAQEMQNIIRQEALWIDYRNKYNKNKAALTEEQKEKLKNTTDFKEIYQEVKNLNVYVEIRASRMNDVLWIEIINTAPILSQDLERIFQKRETFKTHRDAGTEYEFFLTMMDHSDGGSGLGYATIDTHLSDMGMEPFEALNIVSLHSTNAILNLNLNKLSRKE